jgi:hypothetical protein
MKYGAAEEGGCAGKGRGGAVDSTNGRQWSSSVKLVLANEWRLMLMDSMTLGGKLATKYWQKNADSLGFDHSIVVDHATRNDTGSCVFRSTIFAQGKEFVVYHELVIALTGFRTKSGNFFFREKG